MEAGLCLAAPKSASLRCLQQWLRATGGEQMGFGSGPGALNEGNGKQS